MPHVCGDEPEGLEAINGAGQSMPHVCGDEPLDELKGDKK